MPTVRHRSPFLRRVALGALVPMIAAAACSGGSSAPAAGPGGRADAPSTMPETSSEVVFPGATWERTDPEHAGMDPAKLDEIAARADRAGSTCLAVFRNGKLVEDWYWRGGSEHRPQQTYSVTKSFTSTLVGLAQDEGKLRIADRATRYIPEWRGTPSSTVTVEDLISNDSGRHFDLAFDNGAFLRAEDQTSLAISLGQDTAPGRTWAYNNAAIQTLSRVLQRATAEEAADYARRKLLDPLGMSDSVMTKDRAGNTRMYLGLESTCLDMARFGLLYLNHGRWNGRQLLSKRFVAEATGTASTELNGAYGYLFWLNRKGKIAGAVHPATAGVDDDRPITQVAVGAPEDMYWAAGIGGQTIQIDPGSNTVVTRIGPPVHPPGVEEFGRGETAKVVTEALREH